MKKLTTLLFVAGLFFTAQIFAQAPDSVYWELSSDIQPTSISSTLEVTADSMALHGGLVVKDYDSRLAGPAVKINADSNGWGFTGDETWYMDNRFVNFTVQPNAGYNLQVDSVAFWMGCYGTHGAFHAAVYWDIDTNFSQKHLLLLDSNTVDLPNDYKGLPDVRDEANGPLHDTVLAVNTKINDGGKFVLGFFPWYSAGQSTSKYLVLWLVRVYGTTTPATGVEDAQALPKEFSLEQNYPNPFNPTTTIQYNTPKTGFVSLDVYNLLGQKVATLVNEVVQAGFHTVNFNASNLPSGIYMYQLRTDNFNSIKKMTLLK